MATAPAGAVTLAPGEGATDRASRYPLYVLMAVLAIDNADRYLLSSLFPLIKEEFHLSDSQLGTLSAAFVIVATIGVVPFGILCDRYIRTRLVGWGIAVWSSAMILGGLAQSYGALFGSRMFLGTAAASRDPASFSLIADYYPVEERGRVIGIYEAGALLGFLSLPIGGIIGELWGWRAALHAYAVPGFLLAILAFRLPEPVRGNRDIAHQQLETYEAGVDSAFAQLPSLHAFTMVLRIPTVAISVLGFGVSTFFTAGLGIWTATFLVRYHDMSVGTASSAMALLAVGAVAGALLGGFLSDRLVRQGVVAGRIWVAGLSQIFGVVLLFPAFAVDNTGLMLFLFASGAVTLTMPIPAISAVRADVLHPDLRGRAASATSLVGAIGAAASPLLFGVLSDAFTLRTAFLAMVPLMAVGGVLLCTLGPRFLEADCDRMKRQLSGQELPPSRLRP